MINNFIESLNMVIYVKKKDVCSNNDVWYLKKKIFFII